MIKMMNFFLAVNIFVTIITLAKCEEYHSLEVRSCKSVSSDMISTLRATVCAPRPQLVDLTPEPGYEFIPPIVSVKRCTGSCRSKICKPTVFTNATRAVRRMEKGNPSTATCVTLELEEHTICDCRCKVERKVCNDRQEYDRNDCSCKCKNRAVRKASCENDPDRRWFDDTCACKCTIMNRTCESGHVWSPERCTCVHSNEK